MNKPRQKRLNKPVSTGRQKLRIIGGSWRGRKLAFADIPGLRPTTDRVRETVFNWLQMDIHGAQCIDLFAGSGALGLEALSRGAKNVTFIEKDTSAAQFIKEHLNTLSAENGLCVQTDALKWLTTPPSSPVDLVFIDPPFRQGLLPEVCVLLDDNQWLKDGCLIYIEAEKEIQPLTTPVNWVLKKEKTAGQLTSYLFKYQPVESSQ